MTTVTLGNGATRVSVAGGNAQRVTVDRSTIARIGDHRGQTVVHPTPTPVTLLQRDTSVRTGGGMGIQGPGGDDGDLHYHHVQAVPSSTWIIVHALGKYPAVSVVDSGGSTVIGDVKYDSTDQLTVTFAAAFSGEAFCN